MTLSDFSSRQRHDTSNPHKIIPISFNMYNALYETYYRNDSTGRYLVQMQSQMKVAAVKLSEVHGARKTIGTHSPIEKQKPQIQEKQIIRLMLRRGRAGMWHKQPQPVADTLVWTNKSPNIPTNHKVTIDGTKYPVPNQLITCRIENAHYKAGTR